MSFIKVRFLLTKIEWECIWRNEGQNGVIEAWAVSKAGKTAGTNSTSDYAKAKAPLHGDKPV